MDRNRRLRRQDEIESTLRDAHGALTWKWAKAQIRRTAGRSQSWFVVTLVGALSTSELARITAKDRHEYTGAVIGVNAAFISILTEWLSDLRRGYCSEGWWLNQDFCCWEIDEVDAEGACAAWISWSNYTLGNWIVYVLLAVRRDSLMSMLSC